MPDLHFIFEIKCNLSFFQFDPINENHLRFMIARMSNNELFGTVNCHLNKISKSARFNMAAIYNITVHIIVCNSATKISTVMEYCIYTILKILKHNYRNVIKEISTYMLLQLRTVTKSAKTKFMRE